MKKYKVILVDDHTLFRNGLKLLLNQSENIEFVGEASNGEEFLKVFENQPGSIVLMDIEMPVMNGVEATKIAVEKNKNAKIIALTMFNDNEYYYNMIEAGVKGFLLKDSSIDEVLESIEMVAEGKNFFSQELLLSLVKNIDHIKRTVQNSDDITGREKEILQLICKGYSNAEIAKDLYISKRTVDKHRSNLLDKTACKNTASLVMYAIKNGIIQP